MKTKLSVIALTFLLMLTLAFASCGGDPADSNTPDTTSASAETTLSGETTAIPDENLTPEQLVEKKIAELPKDTYGGEEINFFVRSEAFNRVWKSIEIYAEEEINEPLNDAVYRRNRKVEELYDVVISETTCATTGDNFKALAAEIRTLILAGDDTFEVFVPNLDIASTLAGEELLYDLNEIPGLDLESPWWDHNVTEQLSLNNVQYFALGDNAYNDKVATRGIFFNKQLIEDFQLENPYTLVAENKWTLDKMYEMMKTASSDKDSDGVMTELDRYGLIFEGITLYSMMSAMGGTVAELDEDGMPVITFMEPKTQNILPQLFTVLYDRDTGYNDQSLMYKKSGQTDKVNRVDIWFDNRALFFETSFDELEGMRSLETDFGVVPIPKVNTEADWMSSFYFLGPPAFAIPITNQNLEMTGTILEAMAAYSSITLKPAYYEIAIQGKYTRDEDSIAMFDIIFANRVYDIGIINNIGEINTQLVNLQNNRSTNISSMYKRIENKMVADVDAIIESYS